jgi:hypothetical protein
MRKNARKGVIQTQSVRQNVNVIIQTAPARRKKKSSTGVKSRGDLFEAISSQNMREGRKREGVARAVERYGSRGIHHVMPFEQLERIAGGTSSIVWNRNEPEQVNVPRMRYIKPNDLEHTDRPYLKSRVKPEGGGKSYVVEEPEERSRPTLRSDTEDRRRALLSVGPERRRPSISGGPEERRRALLRSSELLRDSDDSDYEERVRKFRYI